MVVVVVVVAATIETCRILGTSFLTV